MRTLVSVGRVALPLIAFMVTCSSCSKGGVTQPTFQSAYEQWRSHNLHDYTIDQKLTCFCPYSGQLVQVTVRADTVASVTRISDGNLLPRSIYVTVDSLFGIIRNSMNDSLDIRYNAEYGYPEYLDVNPQLHPVDGGFLFETSDLSVP
ncbi:MAG: DUF6174 domain-containing protein [Bacteroidetes bacterium]|nr:DUF6174 domain-containing protein [Bacteroidota bacterium]